MLEGAPDRKQCRGCKSAALTTDRRFLRAFLFVPSEPGSPARVDRDPRPRTRRDPCRPRPDRPGLHRLAAVRPRGPVARGSACRSSSRSRRPTRSARSRVAGRGPWSQALAGEGRIGPERPIVCASAGNFGQGVAYAARALGIPVVVFTSVNANRGKIARMRALGAEVISVGEDFDGARGASEAYAAEHARGAARRRRRPAHLDRRRDPRARADRRGREPAICRHRRSSPSRSATARSSTASDRGSGRNCPACRVVGVQAEGAAAMTLSFRAGRPIDTDAAATYADGIAARVAIPRAVELMPGRVDEMRTGHRGGAPRDPGRADRGARDHRRGRRRRVVGRPAGRRATARARPSSSSPAATSDVPASAAKSGDEMRGCPRASPWALLTWEGPPRGGRVSD